MSSKKHLKTHWNKLITQRLFLFNESIQFIFRLKSEKSNDISLRFKTTASSGLILLLHKASTAEADYLAIALSGRIYIYLYVYNYMYDIAEQITTYIWRFSFRTTTKSATGSDIQLHYSEVGCCDDGHWTGIWSEWG